MPVSCLIATGRPPHVSLARGGLRGVPSALTVAGTADPLIDATAPSRKLREAGNGEVELFARERMPHGTYFFPHLLKEGDEAVARFLQRALDASGRPAG